MTGAATSSVRATPEIANPIVTNRIPPIIASASTSAQDARFPLPTVRSNRIIPAKSRINVCSTDTVSRVEIWANRNCAGFTGAALSRRNTPCCRNWTSVNTTPKMPSCIIDIATIPGTRNAV